MSNPQLAAAEARFPPDEQGSGSASRSASEEVQRNATIAEPFAAPRSRERRPFAVRYELAVDHRGLWLISVAAFSILLSSITFLLGPLVFFFGQGYGVLALPFAGYVFFAATYDLRTMREGARDKSGRGLTIVALILSVVAAVATVFYLGYILLTGDFGLLGII